MPYQRMLKMPKPTTFGEILRLWNDVGTVILKFEDHIKDAKVG